MVQSPHSALPTLPFESRRDGDVQSAFLPFSGDKKDDSLKQDQQDLQGYTFHSDIRVQHNKPFSATDDSQSTSDVTNNEVLRMEQLNRFDRDIFYSTTEKVNAEFSDVCSASISNIAECIDSCISDATSLSMESLQFKRFSNRDSTFSENFVALTERYCVDDEVTDSFQSVRNTYSAEHYPHCDDFLSEDDLNLMLHSGADDSSPISTTLENEIQNILSRSNRRFTALSSIVPFMRQPSNKRWWVFGDMWLFMANSNIIANGPPLLDMRYFIERLDIPTVQDYHEIYTYTLESDIRFSLRNAIWNHIGVHEEKTRVLANKLRKQVNDLKLSCAEKEQRISDMRNLADRIAVDVTEKMDARDTRVLRECALYGYAIASTIVSSLCKHISSTIIIETLTQYAAKISRPKAIVYVSHADFKDLTIKIDASFALDDNDLHFDAVSNKEWLHNVSVLIDRDLKQGEFRVECGDYHLSINQTAALQEIEKRIKECLNC